MRNSKAVDPDKRCENVLKAAVELARRDGYMNFTRDDVAAHAGIGAGSVNLAFGTMDKLRYKVMTYAIENEIIEIVAEGMGTGDPQVKKASQGLRQKAAAYLL